MVFVLGIGYQNGFLENFFSIHITATCKNNTLHHFMDD